MRWDKSFLIGLFSGLLMSLVLVSLVFALTLFKLTQSAVKAGATAGSSSAAFPAQGAATSLPLVRGPENAPVNIVAYMDFHCPFCRKAANVLNSLYAKYAGKMRIQYKNFPLSDTPGEGSYLTHEHAMCAAEQNKFWEFYDAVYAMEKAPSAQDLETLEKKIGADSAGIAKCVAGGKYRALIQADFDEGRRLDITGTPVFYINGKQLAGTLPFEPFDKKIQEALNPSTAQPAPAKVPPAPPVVTFEDLKGKPSQGPENAPVTLVEFGDFHCPFCRKSDETFAQLMKSYPGKIRRVWRHFPLDIHGGARRTHEASQCAAEQNKFWEYHDKLYENQGGAHDDAALMRMAKEAGADKGKFEKCLASGKYKSLIESEIEAGEKAGVQGTPTVFINGKKLAGARPYQAFEQMLQTELKTGNAPKS